VSEGRLANVAGAVLLGGASTRMGADKARLEHAGEAFATRLARGLATLFEEVLLVGGDPPPDAPGRRVTDGPGPPSALRGLATALAEARAERVFVAATDLPGLGPDLVLALVAAPAADAVVPRRDGRLHPLCALYRREPVLERARARLSGDDLSLEGLVRGLDAFVLEGEELAAVDAGGLALANVNAPADLEAFRRAAAAGGAPAW
jgi:molybdopterin-guanine dinucleotide biosynthesis protein A